MFVRKIGKDHVKYNIMCQDTGFDIGNNDNRYRLICDGCSDGEHSEIGAELFSVRLKSELLLYQKISDLQNYATNTRDMFHEGDLIKYTNILNSSFDKVLSSMKRLSGAFSIDNKYMLSMLKNYLSFTILFVHMDNKNGKCNIRYFGDGYIIIKRKDGKVIFQDLSEQYSSDIPRYRVYNEIPNIDLPEDELVFREFNYSLGLGSDIENIGVASDGIKYILTADDISIREEFFNIFKDNLTDDKRKVKLSRFLNKYHDICKDDVSISF